MKKTGIMLRFAVALSAIFILQSFVNPVVVTKDTDLSLILKVDEPNPQVGDRVTVNFTIANNSSQTATGVDLQTVIPDCFDLISSVSLNGQQRGTHLFWNDLTIKSNSSLHFVYSARVSDSGSYTSIAEITAADQHDIDSTPGNGADNDNDGIIGSYDKDSTQDLDDEDDGDDVLIVVSEIDLEEEEEMIVEEVTAPVKKEARFLSTVSVYPNPTSHLLKVDIEKEADSPVQIFLFDVSGNMILQKAVANTSLSLATEQLDVSTLIAGNYVVHIKVGNESHVKRVMIVR